MANTTNHAMEIPVIDLSGALSEEELAKVLINAASTSGFFYIKNLGKDIPVEKIDRMFDLSRKFFASPLEEKETVKIKNFDTVRGWTGLNTEALDAKNSRVGDFKEVLNFGEFVDGKAQQPLPPSLIDYESDLNEWGNYCKTLKLKILKLFAIGLKIPTEQGGTNWFSSRHLGGPSGTIWRFCFYPSIPATSGLQTGDLRCGAHSDYGSITLLFQRPSQPGLEILPPSTAGNERNTTSDWQSAPVFPPGTENDPSPPILVNIGDLLSYWTNGYLKSVIHRVVFPADGPNGGEDRYTIAYFGQPVGSATLEAVPSDVVSHLQRLNGVGLEKDNVLTAMGYLLSRFKEISLERPKAKEEIDGGIVDSLAVVGGENRAENTKVVEYLITIANEHGEKDTAVVATDYIEVVTDTKDIVHVEHVEDIDAPTKSLPFAEPAYSVSIANPLDPFKCADSLEHIQPVELVKRGGEDKTENGGNN